MGTRSLTFVTKDEAMPIVCMYRQYDGHPSDHGRELYDFLKGVKITSGIGGDQEVTANGAGCLAAQIIVHFKNSPGGIYLERPNKNMDCEQEYEYWIDVTTSNDIMIRVFLPKYSYGHGRKNLLFSGSVDKFGEWIEKGETKMSWKPVFKMPGDPNWYDNAQRFATKEEAMSSAAARFRAWFAPEAYDAHESEDPVNYSFVDGRDIPLKGK